MAKDFASNQGGTEKAAETSFDPQKGGTPKTGFGSAPKTEDRLTGQGPGVGCSRRGIH